MVEFKIAMLRAELTVQDIADKLAVSPRYIRYLVAGKRAAPELRRRVIEECGLPFEAVMPPELRPTIRDVRSGKHKHLREVNYLGVSVKAQHAVR